MREMLGKQQAIPTNKSRAFQVFNYETRVCYEFSPIAAPSIFRHLEMVEQTHHIARTSSRQVAQWYSSRPV